MSLPEIAIWAVCSVFLVVRIAMLGVFVAMPVVIVRALYRHSEA